MLLSTIPMEANLFRAVRALAAVETIAASLCSPSRAATSTISTAAAVRPGIVDLPFGALTARLARIVPPPAAAGPARIPRADRSTRCPARAGGGSDLFGSVVSR